MQTRRGSTCRKAAAPLHIRGPHNVPSPAAPSTRRSCTTRINPPCPVTVAHRGCGAAHADTGQPQPSHALSQAARACLDPSLSRGRGRRVSDARALSLGLLMGTPQVRESEPRSLRQGLTAAVLRSGWCQVKGLASPGPARPTLLFCMSLLAPFFRSTTAASTLFTAAAQCRADLPAWGSRG